MKVDAVDLGRFPSVRVVTLAYPGSESGGGARVYKILKSRVPRDWIPAPVLTAVSAEEAMELFRLRAVDAVICDLEMPDMGWWELAKAIKEIARKKGIPKPPFILQAGWIGRISQEDASANNGVDAIVKKPINLEKLLRTVQELVRIAKMQAPK